MSQGPGEDLRPALGTVEQQSPFGNATQQAQEAAAQTELVALNNRMELSMELRRSEEQFRRIAAPLNCSLT